MTGPIVPNWLVVIFLVRRWLFLFVKYILLPAIFIAIVVWIMKILTWI